MRRHLRSIAAVLLLWLPLQALALPLAALHCAADELAASAADHDGAPPCHAHEGAGDDGAPANAPDDDAAVKPPHFCCSHFFALPPIFIDSRAEPVAIDVPALVLPQYAYFPEQFDRPPRA